MPAPTAMSRPPAERPHRPPTEAEVRARRQAAALRANLSRRKAQVRARAASAMDAPDPSAAPSADPTPPQLREQP
jgi:hypothetical protein